MSNYYEYQRVGTRIAHRLMRLNGWKVYGYKPDESDSMTDYWSPAYWTGTAEKNGYTLVFNRSNERKEPRVYTVSETVTINDNAEKLEKLRAMTVDRGASAQEEETAKKKIAKILAESEEIRKKTSRTVIDELAHMANPTRCSWHIEKDGIIIDKGTGLLKFSSVWDITDERYQKEWQDFNNLSEKAWKQKFMNNYYYPASAEELERYAKRAYDDAKEAVKLLEAFNRFINRIDTTCGGMIGKEGQEYKKVTRTEYKKVNKAYETKSGKIEVGQCFILKRSFNYGRTSGSVYRIKDVEYNPDGSFAYFRAYKLNGKLTKECTGYADSSNRFWCDTNSWNRWFNRGSIAFCEIREEHIPYEVEKLVKVKKYA